MYVSIHPLERENPFSITQYKQIIMILMSKSKIHIKD